MFIILCFGEEGKWDMRIWVFILIIFWRILINILLGDILKIINRNKCSLVK